MDKAPRKPIAVGLELRVVFASIPLVRHDDGLDDAWRQLGGLLSQVSFIRQRDRRNLSHTEFNSYVAHVVRASDRLKQVGRPSEKLASPDANLMGRSAADLADRIGVSQATVERTGAVLASEEDEAKERLLTGDIAPKAAYEQVRRVEAAKADLLNHLTTPVELPRDARLLARPPSLGWVR